MNKNQKIALGIAVLLLVLSAITLLMPQNRTPTDQSIATTTLPSTNTNPVRPVVSSVLPYGKVVLRSGETATFARNAITLLRVVDDSRCATGVQCIWAGTLHAEVRSITGMGTSTETIELGKSFTTEAETIALVSAEPYPQAGKTIAPSDYRLTFEVTQRTTAATPTTPVTPKPKPPVQAVCYTGGCSGEICSDRPDVASNCIYRSEFACYKKSTCERQASGECGWTETPELRSCLSNPPAL